MTERKADMDPETQRERYCEAIRGGRLYRILANDPRYRPLDKYVYDFAHVGALRLDGHVDKYVRDSSQRKPLFGEKEWCLHCGSDTCECAAQHNAAYGDAS